MTQTNGQADEDSSPVVTGPPPLEAVASEGRPNRSRLLWAIDRWAGLPLTALGVLAASAVWILLSVIFGFPSGWERIFQSLVAAITVTMVFVIQHTQARHQAATQRKLDEILRALPEADNSLLTLEHASDAELRAARSQHRQVRQAALNQPPRDGQDRLERGAAATLAMLGAVSGPGAHSVTNDFLSRTNQAGVP